MPSEETILCPLCGKVVPSDVKKCPYCSSSIDRIRLRREIDKVIEHRIMRRIKAKSEVGAAPTELPSAPIPDVTVTCPSCGMELAGHEAKCSRCGVPLIDEAEMLECPECGTKFAPGTSKCPECGVSFASEEDVKEPQAVEAAPAVIRAPEPPPSSEPVRAIRPEPELAGRGLTNGRGAINGTGLVNGTGMINGTAGARPRAASRRRGIAASRWPFLAVLVALIIIIPAFIYMSYSKDEEGFSVDGRFGDWDDSDMYSMSILTTSPLTVVEEWAVGTEDTKVFLYVKARGDIMGTSSVESLFLFVDSDDDPGTGFIVGALGADFMIELDGWNDTVQSSNVFTYDSSDPYDWSKWRSLGGVVSRLDGSSLEAMGNIQSTPSPDAKFLLASQDQMNRRMVSTSVPAAGGVLVVAQRLSDSAPVSGVLPSSASAPLLTLEFTCDGVGGTVTAVDVETSGVSSMADEVGTFSLQVGEVVVRHLAADTSGLSAGQLVSAYVMSSGIQSSFASVVVTGHPARAYVSSAPSEAHIDGAFGEWYGRTASDVDLIEVANANVDVNEVGVFNTTDQAAFFVSVDGEMLGGSYVPVIKGKPVPGGGGGPVVPVRKTAEDITWIFIDSDMSAATGKLMSVDSKVIGADYRIEVRGVQGAVVSSSLHQYTGTLWALVDDDVPAEVDLHRLEVAVAASSIGGQAALDFIIQTTDWRAVGDFASLDEATMLALTGGLSMGVGTEAWAVDSSMSQSATATSVQRKLFYDGTNFWSLYFDGSDTVCKYSSTGGLSWTDAGQVFETTGIWKTSLWYDSSAGKVYVIGDSSSASEYAYIRNGTVTASPASITWGNEYQLDVSTTNHACADKDTYITKDATGSVWVVVETRIHATEQRYNLRTASTASGDDIEGTWTDQGNLVSPRVNDPYGSATLLPGKAGSGVAVWAVYSYEGSVRSRTHSGSGWSSEMVLYAAGTSTDNTIYAPSSALIDGNGVVHVLYGTGDMSGSNWKPNIHHIYSTSTSTWSSPISWASDSNVVFRYPSISLDTSTGNVYALWISDAPSADGVEVRKNVSGSWSSLSVAQTTFVKTNLTAIYSAPAEAYICWQWTQNTTPQYDVVFDKIPEFSDAALPVLFVLTIFIAIYRRRSRDRGPTK